MSGPATVAVLAPAKVNLWLEVLGLREDGFHEISTWMLAVDLCDRIEARRSEQPGVRLEVRGQGATSDIPPGSANLAWKGAEEVLRLAGRAGGGVDLVLDKRIPSQAGLGGGSSDAAAAWMAASAVLGVDLGTQNAKSALARLGSDCVFFHEARETGLAHCSGRGEQVRPEPGPARAWWIALATPEIVCPTAQVYAAHRRLPRQERTAPELPARWSELPASEVRPFVFNRLEAAALEAVPRLRSWRAALEASGKGLWHLSGSGSSYFALCDSRAEAEELLDRLRRSCRAAGIPIRGACAQQPAGHLAKFLGTK
ncbi:MAG: 4-(cytidine 5'-diphospho)-2-C-methyl-D-erythritol kinase [Planctomycetota bacterium]